MKNIRSHIHNKLFDLYAEPCEINGKRILTYDPWHRYELVDDRYFLLDIYSIVHDDDLKEKTTPKDPSDEKHLLPYRSSHHRNGPR